MDHSHYGPDTQKALRLFQDLYVSYSKFTGFKQKEDTNRTDVIQAAWDKLAKARKEETGSGFYLTAEQYATTQNGRFS